MMLLSITALLLSAIRLATAATMKLIRLLQLAMMVVVFFWVERSTEEAEVQCEGGHGTERGAGL